jgi:hypothetical protein
MNSTALTIKPSRIINAATAETAAIIRRAPVNFRRSLVVSCGVLALAAAATACGARAEQPPKPAEPAVAWRALGSWSGHGNQQTESFTSDTGTLRVRWETTAGSREPGSFRLTAHSAISGRPLQQVVDVVDARGARSGIGYVQQDPHVFYVVIESRDVNWKFTVEEAVGYGG